MSNGARLSAVLVVVAVAAIGLYFAFMTPPANPSANTLQPAGSVAQPDPATGIGELSGAPAVAAGDANGAPAPEAFAAGGSSTGAAAGAAVAQASGTGNTTVTTANGGAKGASAGTTTIIPTGASPSGGYTVTTRDYSSPAQGTPVPSGAPAPTTMKDMKESATEAVTEYTVKNGDTLVEISRLQLGDASKWKSIVDLNPGTDPKTLKVGQKLKMPAKSARAGTAKPVDAPAATTASAANTYTVQKGDTLVAIARKFYGADADWKRILAANSTQLKGDAEALRPGMKIAIPAKK